MNINNIIKKVLTEATTDVSSRGTYISPLLPGYRDFEKHISGPFTEFVNQWDDAMLDHDSLDGSMSTDKKTIRKREKKAEKIAKYIKNNPDQFAYSDEAGVMNAIPKERSDAKPMKNYNPKEVTISLDGVVKKQINSLKKKITENSFTYKTPPINEWVALDKINLNEDLAVWFGKKKKPKGSKQPKGPWVDICRKVNGKHPPCGRSDADKGKYPKCRAAGVAGKMSDSAKKAACRQKRNAEKQDTQTGKGQKPIMTSYKPKKNIKENIMNRRRMINESDVRRLVKRILNESAPTAKVDLQCVNTTQNKSRNFYNMKVVSEKNVKGGIGAGGHIELFLQREKTVLAGGVVLQDGATVGASNLKLDLVPTENVSKYANPQISQDKLANPNNAFNAVFMIGHTENVSYFCRIAADPENKWEEYIYTL